MKAYKYQLAKAGFAAVMTRGHLKIHSTKPVEKRDGRIFGGVLILEEGAPYQEQSLFMRRHHVWRVADLSVAPVAPALGAAVQVSAKSKTWV